MINDTPAMDRVLAAGGLPRRVRVWALDLVGPAIWWLAIVPVAILPLAIINALVLDRPARGLVYFGIGAAWAFISALIWYLMPAMGCLAIFLNVECVYFLNRFMLADIAVFRHANPEAAIKNGSFIGACLIGAAAVAAVFVFNTCFGFALWIMSIPYTP